MEVSFGGGKIHYSDTGAGKIIVLIHGYLEAMSVWENFGERLSRQCRVVSIDLPGHSMGGYATLAFLQMFPEYLNGYSLFHSQPLADTPDSIERRKENIAIVEKGEKHLMIPGFIRNLYAPANYGKLEEKIELSISIASGVKKITIIADLKGMLARPDRVYLIEKGSVPFLWILGKMYSHINYEIIQKRVQLPGNTRVVILNNSGHLGFIEEEELSAKIVSDFINGLPG